MDSYLAPIPYYINGTIYEYDISKANINILFNKGAISEQEYENIKLMSRESRQIYVGYMLRDNKKLSSVLSEGLAEFRSKFIDSNDISQDNILSVKKDAMFIINTKPRITKFENVEFMCKNIYSSFFKIGRLEAYYAFDRFNDTETIDIKGINDSKLSLHIDGMLYFICEVFKSILTSTIDDTISYIKQFHSDYLNRELPVEYYREFNEDSCFRVTDSMATYLLNNSSQSELKNLDINYNISIIMDLFSIASEIYFSANKGR